MAAPLIVKRDAWGAKAPIGPWTHWPAGEPTGNTIHWEGAGGHPDHGMCATEVRSIQAYELTKGYVDVAYNWLVCNHGVIFEGRPADTYESAAQFGGNPLHIAICYIGGPNFPFTDAAKLAIAWLVCVQAPFAARAHAIGHRDDKGDNTQCPGDVIEAWVKAGGAVSVSKPPQPLPQPTPPPSPLPVGGVHHPVIHIGNVGAAVLELQRKLDGVAGASLAQDGSFGPKTQTVVENFQRFFKLAVDGVAGPATWGMLDYCCALHGIH